MTERLPAVRPKDVIRALQRADFFVARTSGSHCRLVHRANAARKVTVPIHNKDLKRGTLRALLAQAGLTIAEFIALL